MNFSRREIREAHARNADLLEMAELERAAAEKYRAGFPDVEKAIAMASSSLHAVKEERQKTKDSTHHRLVGHRFLLTATRVFYGLSQLRSRRRRNAAADTDADAEDADAEFDYVGCNFEDDERPRRPRGEEERGDERPRGLAGQQRPKPKTPDFSGAEELMCSHVPFDDAKRVEEEEEEKKDGVIGIRAGSSPPSKDGDKRRGRRRCGAPPSYREPSLNAKLRKGDEHTFGNDI